LQAEQTNIAGREHVSHLMLATSWSGGALAGWSVQVRA